MHIIYMTDYLVQFDAFSQEQCKKFLKQRDFRKEQLQMGIVTVSLDGNGITTLPPMSKKRFKHNLAVRFGDVSDQKVDALYNDSRRGTRRQSFSAFGGSGAEETGVEGTGDNGGNFERPESPVVTETPNSFAGYGDSILSTFISQTFEESADTEVESKDEEVVVSPEDKALAVIKQNLRRSARIQALNQARENEASLQQLSSSSLYIN